MGERPASVALGDLNGDGRLDIVTANERRSDVTVLLAQASGGYSNPYYYSVGFDPISVAVGDVNGDGRLDIVTANLVGKNVTVLLAQAGGGYTGTDYAVGDGVSGVISVAVGDVNGDGRGDIVATGGGSVTVLLAQAGGGFAPTAYAGEGEVAVGDVNGDGRLDILTANLGGNTVTVLLAQTGGGYTGTDYAVGDGPNSIAVGDVNGDGRLDIVTANGGFLPLNIKGSKNVTVLLAQAGGYARTDYAVGVNPLGIALGDVNGDGRGDIVTPNVTVLLAQAGGGYAPTTYDVGIYNQSVAVGDVNGDGRGDIVTTNGAINTVTVLLSNQAPPSAPVVLGSPTYCQGVPAPASLSLLVSATGPLNLYTTPTGGTALADLAVPTPTEGLFTYYVSQKGSGDCESARSAIEVRVTPCSPALSPTLQISSTKLSNFVTNAGTPSVSQTYSLTALSQTGGIVRAPTGYEIRTGNAAFGPVVSIPGSLSPVIIAVEVRLKGTAAGPVSGVIRHQLFDSSNQSIQNVAVSGTVGQPGVPTIVVSSLYLDVVDYSTYSGSLPTSYTVAAAGLGDGLEIIAPPNFRVSAAGLSGQAIVIHTTDGILPPTTVSVALVVSTPGQYGGYIINKDWNRTAQTSIFIIGTALGQDVIVKPLALTNFTTTVGTPSASQSYTVTTRGGLQVNVTPPAGFEVRTGNNPFGPGFVIEASPVFKDTPIDIRLTGTTAGPISTSVTHDTYFHSSHDTYPLAVSGFVFGNGYGLRVLHRDVDNYANNNSIRPVLIVANGSQTPLPLSAITLRYYLTVENFFMPLNLPIYYAQVGAANVKARYVPLEQPRQGAFGYVEYSFTAGAGQLAAGKDSGPIQGHIDKSDYGGLNELDDYSYATVRDKLLENPRITAYYNGVLVWGQEPPLVTPQRQLRVFSESKNGPSATAISTYLDLRNEGNLPVDFKDVRIRYYFTADQQKGLTFSTDFRYQGQGTLQGQLVSINPPLANADTYLEITPTFSGQLMPLSNLGVIRYSIYSPQGSRFNQTNDYSYQERPTELSPNSRIVVYVGQERVWGVEPGASARQAAAEPSRELSVRVLGNPVAGATLDAEVRGAGGQPLSVQLTNLWGRVVARQHLAAAGEQERVRLEVGHESAGVFLLQVSTPTQSRTLRVLKAE